MNKYNIISALVFSVTFPILSSCTSERTCQDVRADHYKEINAPGLTLEEILIASNKYETEFRGLGCPGKILD